MAPSLEVGRLNPADAALALAGVERTDPRGVADAFDLRAMCDRGACFVFAEPGSGSQAVMVLRVERGRVWVDACKGSGPIDWTATLLPGLELMFNGARSVGFQTSRRGLVRKAREQGYSVTGWILRKELQP